MDPRRPGPRPPRPPAVELQANRPIRPRPQREMNSSTYSPPCMISVSIFVGRPRRHFPVDPLLQLYDQRADDREYDQARKNFFRFHHLPGLDEQKAHPALARATDHFG